MGYIATFTSMVAHSFFLTLDCIGNMALLTKDVLCVIFGVEESDKTIMCEYIQVVIMKTIGRLKRVKSEQGHTLFKNSKRIHFNVECRCMSCATLRKIYKSESIMNSEVKND